MARIGRGGQTGLTPRKPNFVNKGLPASRRLPSKDLMAFATTFTLPILLQTNMFLVFDGIDGAGKSTQLKLLADWLCKSGRDVVCCQDPGSTELGKRLRAILLDHDSVPIHMRAEMMMFTTARTQLVEEVVRPTLAKQHFVLLDRYIDSTLVYQGYAGDLEVDDLKTINRIATDGLLPDATFIFDMPVETAMQRMGNSLDRVESRGKEYLQRVRDGFLTIADPEQNAFVIDASRDIETIQAELRQIVTEFLAQRPTRGATR